LNTLVSFREISCEEISWNRVNFASVTVFQLPFWLEYYKKSGIEYCVISIRLQEKEIGHIVLCSRKFMLLTHLGAPLPGTATGFGGIVFYEEPDPGKTISGIPVSEVYGSLTRYLSRRSGYINISDLKLVGDTNFELCQKGVSVTFRKHYFLDLQREWDEIFRSFKDKSCRYEYRKGLKNGFSVSFNPDVRSFAEYHYDHILNVYNRKGLVPTFSKKRLLNIIEALMPDHVLLGTCLNQNKEPIASCIVIFNEYCSFLTTSACMDNWLGKGANELLMVECIREVKEKGATRMEFGGGMNYKEKYGTILEDVPVIEYNAPYNLDYHTIGKIYKKIRKFPIVQLFLRRYKF
jgi:hypothetical protein